MRAFRSRAGVVVAAAVAVLTLAALSTVAVAAVVGGFRSRSGASRSVATPAGRCDVPALAGSVVDVALTNMGGAMMRGAGPMTGGWAGGTMRVRADRTNVAAGTVSFRVVDTGSLVHELVVLPLAPGAHAGQRSVGSDGRVDETGSVGEASRSCGKGAGDGIDPGSVGWVTLRLAAGNYELVCNLPGHYGAGMYTELHVR